jgi:uncharacterized damage-inducible protein DinB
MNREIQSIISKLEDVLVGDPWFGRPVYALLREIDPATVYRKPNGKGHSLIELLYHTLNWVSFCLQAVENKPGADMHYFEERDWISIDPGMHTWEKGFAELKETHRQLIVLLQTKEDALLNETVPGRRYNYRVMLNGLIDHNIYHLGQIAYVKKFLL